MLHPLLSASPSEIGPFQCVDTFSVFLSCHWAVCLSNAATDLSNIKSLLLAQSSWDHQSWINPYKINAPGAENSVMGCDGKGIKLRVRGAGLVPALESPSFTQQILLHFKFLPC